MAKKWYALIYFTVLISNTLQTDHSKLSEQIKAVLDHYKSADPVGIPGQHIPDPMPIPKIKRYISFYSLQMYDSQIHGLSKFRIENVFSNLADMQVMAALKIDQLEVKGNYTLQSFVTRSAGGCTVTLNDVYIEGIAMMEVAREGNLEAADIQLDISVQDIALDFQNLGLLGSIFQGMMNSIGTFVFDSIKPFILAEVNVKVRGQINKNMQNMKQTFPNSIPPLDLAIAEGRKYVRKMKYDPYKMQDYSQTAGFLGYYVTNTQLTGLSSFYRVGNITVSVRNNVLQIGFHVGTQELKGSCNWEIAAANVFSHVGITSFTVDYFRVEAIVNQSLDTRNHPELGELQLTLGNIQLRSDGTGSLDYVLEALVNILPNILRYQIMDALEEPLRRRIQQILDDVNVESVIEDKLPDIEKLVSGEEDLGAIIDIPEAEVTTELAITTPIQGLVIDESQLNQDIY